MTKPSIVKGTRDFGPNEMVRRNYLFDTIRTSFQRYGYLPIETPSMEKTETLMGKYGEEGDRLIFRILNSGQTLEKADTDAVGEGKLVRFANSVSEKALRYDLTVPFARFVVQHQNELTFPFKRYQIQNVWRADRPQKGRYREFFQCDADVVGSDSLLYEIELVQLFDEVLTNLKLTDFTIKINNRKILSGLAEVIGEPDKIVPITVAIDELDKIGVDGVIKKLQEKEVSESGIEQLKPLLEGDLNGSIAERLDKIETFLKASEIGLKGVEEMRYVLTQVQALGLQTAKLEFDVTLARGLNYYTGAIFEVKANNVSIGSICGGGRYDDLTSIFGMKNMSGVGISFGADRIYDVLAELNLFPDFTAANTQLIFANYGEKESTYCLGLLKAVRAAGINAEMYPKRGKIQRQMQYANDKNVPYVALIGTDEMESGAFALKDMNTGEQQNVDLAELINILKK